MNSSALNLISHYGGDSSDDEVPGFRASTKRLHKDDSDEEFLDNKRLYLYVFEQPDIFVTNVLGCLCQIASRKIR